MQENSQNDSGFTIEEMVDLLKKGNMQYFDVLFKRFYPLIFKFEKTYHLKTLEREDFFQEARIVLYRSIKEYDEKRGMQFAGFYKLMLQNRIFSLIRRESALKRKSEKNTTSYTRVGDLDFADKYVSETRKIEAEGIDSIIHVREMSYSYFETLSAFEKEVFRNYMKGDDYETIAQKTNKSAKQVQYAYDRCRQKMKNLLE